MTFMRATVSVLTLALALAAPSLAAAQESAPVTQDAAAADVGVSDPWEPFNRDLYAVHNAVDQAVLEPVARGYRAITPRPLRQGVLNVLRNLRGPAIFANDVLQGEIGRAGTTAARFGINTTIGVAGIFDPASSMGLERHDEDFGQTLAVWGVDSGPYLFIPLMGPSNVRDTAGRVVDTVFDPLRWVGGENIEDWRIARTVTTGIAARELVLEAVDDIRRDSVDPYTSFRSSYDLLRESAIQNGETDVNDLPDFESIDGGGEPAATPSGEIEQQPPEQADAAGLAQAGTAPKSWPNEPGGKY
jgi:phospholipid-binding lipoprotein MlaA